MMLRLNILLAVVLLASCFWLVRSSHDARQLFVELERSQNEFHNLQVEAERLELDKRAQTTLGRVQDLAQRHLHMRNHDYGITHIVNAQGEAVAAPDASAAQGASR